MLVIVAGEQVWGLASLVDKPDALPIATGLDGLLLCGIKGLESSPVSVSILPGIEAPRRSNDQPGFSYCSQTLIDDIEDETLYRRLFLADYPNSEIVRRGDHVLSTTVCEERI
jgi:hypothetical protein